jgi:dolichol kinase
MAATISTAMSVAGFLVGFAALAALVGFAALTPAALAMTKLCVCGKTVKVTDRIWAYSGKSCHLARFS